ncbi:hypothetical protein CIG75_09840 [Tumebacillus algifaecis]|uniref:DUF1641 domain-containing protein n=1 Tax=Tumebacillus algifaecis TaxID=1214604 RepID=A0A223D199_9BACL|nr:DUF1641 domain-containing protein [Tumebacillus algifaecis]ASS75255.1 hypothetical protein CIG75_09840 [Tumebacillus algifaecis]
MAKATTQIEKRVPSQAEQEADALKEVLGAVVQHKDALLTFLDVLGELHDAGTLEMAQGALKSRHKIGVIGMNQLNKSGAQNMIKNGMSTLQFLGQLDPNKLQTLLASLAAGVEHAVPTEPEPKNKKTGVFDLIKGVRDPEVSSSLSMLLNFLRGMGAKKGGE